MLSVINESLGIPSGSYEATGPIDLPVLLAWNKCSLQIGCGGKVSVVVIV